MRAKLQGAGYEQKVVKWDSDSDSDESDEGFWGPLNLDIGQSRPSPEVGQSAHYPSVSATVWLRPQEARPYSPQTVQLAKVQSRDGWQRT